MRAAVGEHIDRAIWVADHDDRLLAELASHPIAGLADLGLVGSEGPSTNEDAVHLVGEGFVVVEEAGMDAVSAHQSCVIDAHVVIVA